jgi:hypothetical protein
MLKKISTIFFLLFSINAFPCWIAEGTFTTDGEVWKFNQKIEHNKEYIIPAGEFAVHLVLVEKNKKPDILKYEIKQKKGLKLELISKGEEEELELNKVRDIFAKGEEGKPNSIITIKLSKI